LQRDALPQLMAQFSDGPMVRSLQTVDTDTGDLCDRFIRKLLEVAEQKNLPLSSGQRSDRFEENLFSLVEVQPCWGGRVIDFVQSARAVVGAGPTGQRIEGLSVRDAEHPTGQRLRLVQLTDGPQDLQPAFLRGIVRIRMVAQHPTQVPVNGHLPFLKQDPKRGVPNPVIRGL
jgi:hypothetical protein